MERPAFAKDYPDDVELLSLVDAFEAGDYRAVRAGTKHLEADADRTAAVKDAARDLRSRTEPHRVQLALLAIAALLVVVLSGYEIAKHGHDVPRPTPPGPTIEHVH